MLDREGVELEKLETDPSALELGENGDSGPDGEDVLHCWTYVAMMEPQHHLQPTKYQL